MTSSLSDLGFTPEEKAETPSPSMPSSLADIGFQPEASTSEKPGIGALGQFAAGAATYLTWPADVLKSAVQQSGIDTLKELGEDTPEARAIVNKMANKIPVQEDLERYLETKTGKSFKPQGFGEESARAAGTFFNPKGILTGGAKQIGKTLAKRGLTAAAGGIGQKTLEEEGVPSIVAGLAGAGISSIGDLERKFSAEGKELKDLAQKHALRESQYMAKEKSKILPLITKGHAEKIRSEVAETSKQAIERIVNAKHPISDLRKQGINIDAFSEKLLNKTSEAAKKSTRELNLEPLIESIDKKIDEVRASAPSLSESDKKFIDILETKKEDFAKQQFIKHEQFLNQYRKNNKDRFDFYKNPQTTHLQDAANSAYGFVNEEMVKLADVQADEAFMKPFKASNKIYSEKSDLNKVESILQPFFDEPTIDNLNSILKNDKKTAWLKKKLGPDGLNEVMKIGKYAKRAQDKLNEQFHQHGDSWVSVARDIGLASFLSIAHPDITKMLDLGIGASYARGLVLSNKTMRGDLIDFEKALASGSKRAIRLYSTKLNEDFDKTLGNPEDLISKD
jgi:hypothetical protein